MTTSFATALGAAKDAAASQHYPQGALYVVATPIGNLADITLRALHVLQLADAIACEDTRTSGKLLNHFNIPTKTWAYHDHNAEVQTPKLIEILQSGQNIALISDAGTPLISDPGFRLVRACHQADIKVSPVVGASDKRDILP